jgi:hypothetical protein
MTSLEAAGEPASDEWEMRPEVFFGRKPALQVGGGS